MSKLPRWREASVLLLPVLALGGVAAWTQGRAPRLAPRDESGPLRLVVQRVERQDATARDVAEGFDTRVELTLNYKGPRQEEWGGRSLSWGSGGLTLFQADGKGGTQGLSERSAKWLRDYRWRNPEFDQASQTYKAAFLFRLADRAASPRAVRCAAEFYVESNANNSEKSLMGAPISFAVLRAGEKALAPRNVPRVSPISVREVKVETTDFATFTLKATMDAEGVPEGPAKVQMVGKQYLEDETGRRYEWDQPFSYEEIKGGSFACDWLFQGTQLPLKARRLTFHSRLSLGESWPVEIKAVLWDKTKPAKT